MILLNGRAPWRARWNAWVGGCELWGEFVQTWIVFSEMLEAEEQLIESCRDKVDIQSFSLGGNVKGIALRWGEFKGDLWGNLFFYRKCPEHTAKGGIRYRWECFRHLNVHEKRQGMGGYRSHTGRWELFWLYHGWHNHDGLKGHFLCCTGLCSISYALVYELQHIIYI